MPESGASTTDLTLPKQRVAGAIRDWIDAGELRPGERLPTDRALSARLDASVSTVRRALSELEEAGVITSKKAVGKFVAEGGRSSPLLRTTVALVTEWLRESPASGEQSTGSSIYRQIAAVEALRAEGFNALLMPAARLTEARALTPSDRPAGLIAFESGFETPPRLEALKRLHQAGVPVAVFQGVREAPEFDEVLPDHEGGCRDLTRWLIQHRARRPILFIPQAAGASLTPTWLPARIEGYRRACREAGIEPAEPLFVPDTVRSAPDFEQRARLAAGFLVETLTGPEPADAILCATDMDVFPVARACRILGLVPNRDVLLAGYDNYWSDCPESARMGTGPAVTIDKRNADVGRTLVDVLLSRVRADAPDQPVRRTVPSDLITTRYGRIFLGGSSA